MTQQPSSQNDSVRVWRSAYATVDRIVEVASVRPTPPGPLLQLREKASEIRRLVMQLEDDIARLGG